MKILLLGARGNLGGQLKKVFAEHDVIPWDREEIDITDKTLIIKKIVDLKPDVVINAAAYNAVDKCEEDEAEYELAERINGDAPGYIAQGVLKAGSILIHYSSDYVFGGDIKDEDDIKRMEEAGGFKEDDDTAPINKYGETKLLGEKNIISLSGKGLKWYIIRTSKLFGQLGDSAGAKPSFFDLMQKLGETRQELDVVDEEVSCFTYTTDLAQATKDLLDERAGFGIYHFINEGAMTWHMGAKIMFSMLEKNIKLNAVTGDKFPRPAKRPKYSVLANTKFKKLRSFKKALREYLDEK